MSTFQDLGLPPRLIQNLSQKNIIAPSAVQVSLIPFVNSGKDVLVCAETGSGKTLAYLLPIMTRLAGEKSLLGVDSCHTLVLVPTRELAIQVNKEIEWLSEGTGVKSVLLTGGQEVRYQASLLRRNPEFVVATPGRAIEHLNRKSLVIDDVRVLVLDEADKMLDMGFRDEVMALASHIASSHQTLMLSATLKHRGISKIASDLLNDPKLVQLSSAREVNANVKLEMILADDYAHKLRLLTWLLGNRPFSKALVFANKRETVEKIADGLRQHGYDFRFLHGEITQDARRKIMAGFREGRFKALVATDVAARGLDVGGLDLVINFDMAHSGEEFVHRAGRTGRAGELGTLISLVSANEWNLSVNIQRYLNATFEKVEVPGLTAGYQGPRRLKSSGKAAGPRKKKRGSEKKAGNSSRKKPGAKKSLKKGNPASRKKVSTNAEVKNDQGFTPLKRPPSA